jgi:L-ascorbate metabolism protein UlaG (beta-lactamase superfamily)
MIGSPRERPDPPDRRAALDRLTYIGHATVLLRVERTSILTDPILRGWLGPLRRYGRWPEQELTRNVDLVLISHVHRDHLDRRSLRRLPRSTPLVVPRGATRWAARGGAEEIREIGVDETISIAGVEVTAVRAVHDGHRDGRRGPGAEVLGYVIRGGGRTIYFAGDTDVFAEMSELGSIDVALLPVWGWGTSVGAGHLDPARAARALELIRPRVVVPIHWGTFFPLGLQKLRPLYLSEPPLELARLAARLTPEVEVRVLEPGSETTF